MFTAYNMKTHGSQWYKQYVSSTIPNPRAIPPSVCSGTPTQGRSQDFRKGGAKCKAIAHEALKNFWTAH